MRSSSGRSGSITAREPAAMIAWSNSTFSSADVELVLGGELRLAVDDVHLALLREAVEPTGQLADDVVLPGAKLVDVDLGVGERDAELGRILGLGEHLGGVKKSLGRNAADVEANAADPLMALDQRDLEPKIGGAKRGGVPTGPRAHHHDPLPLGLLGSPRAEWSISRDILSGLLTLGVGGVGFGRLGLARPRTPPPDGSDSSPRFGAASASPPRPSPRRRPPSSTTIGVPSLTLSLTETRTSFTVPASGEGTSIVALSDSSVTQRLLDLDLVALRDVDLDDGDLVEVADVWNLDLAQSNALRMSESSSAEVRGEARGGGAVDHAVVVAQRERDHQARLELLGLLVPDRLHLRARRRPGSPPRAR